MKNIFKSLMFVAVAAMTFTACEKDNAENNNNNGTEQKTAITFNAEFADTRSYFTENNGEGYASAWTEGDEVKFQAVNYYSAGEYYTSVGNPTAYIDENNCLSATFNGIQGGDIIKAYSPATKWNVSVSMYGIADDYTIPSEQTPTATSVDPQAHILMAEDTYTGSNNMSLTFAHQVAYGKFSLTNFAGTDATAVILDIDGAKYTIKLDNINIATEPIWFACEPNGKVSNMTVSVNATEGGYPKQIITGGDKNLEFIQGQVSTFIVDMTDVTTGEAVDTFNPDVLLAEPTWNGSYYKFNYTDDSGNNFRIYINSEDRPNNVISVNTYSGCGSTEPNKGQFGAALYDSLGWRTFYATAFTEASTLDVSFADGVYTIILTHSGKTYGYKGMPEGWTAPAGGGETPEVVKLATPKVTATVDGKNVTVSWNAVDGAANYTVSVDGAVKESAYTSTTYPFEGTYSTTHTISVVANPANTTTHSVSDAGTTTAVIGADPNAGGGEGGGDEPITYDPWPCTGKVLSGNSLSAKVQLTGTGANQDVIVLNGVSMFGTTITSAELNGETVDASGTASLNTTTYCCDFNITIGNTTYKGSTSNQVM